MSGNGLIWKTQHHERSIVGHDDILDLLLRGLVNVLLVVGDDALGDGLTDGVDLGGAATGADTDLSTYNTEHKISYKNDRIGQKQNFLATTFLFFI